MPERLVPRVGDYLTDGERLVEVMNQPRDGQWIVENCVTFTEFVISKTEAWRRVLPEAS